MGLHQIEIMFGDRRLDATREGPIASGTAAEQCVKRSPADDSLEAGVGTAFPVTGDQRYLCSLGDECSERAFNEALGSAERVVALANDSQFQMLVLRQVAVRVRLRAVGRRLRHLFAGKASVLTVSRRIIAVGQYDAMAFGTPRC